MIKISNHELYKDVYIEIISQNKKIKYIQKTSILLNINRPKEV